MARASATGSCSWMSHLPFVLLGLRSSVRVDADCSPADLLYGGSLRLPGDMFVGSTPSPSPSDFVAQLRSVMSAATPMPVSYHGVPPSRVDRRLSSASHVFIRIDSVRRPLVPPYEGPFLVLGRSDKTFDLQRNGKTVTVSIDRLKPAMFLPEDPPPGPPPTPSVLPPPSPSAPSGHSSEVASAPPSLDPAEWPLPAPAGPRVPRPLIPFRTASGRISRPPDRLTA